MRSASRQSSLGLGIAEALIAGALALALLGLLHRFLVPVIQGSARTSVKVHLRQQATVVIEHLAQDIAMSSASTVSYLGPSVGTPSTSPVVLAFSRAIAISAAGRPLYETQVTLYVWDPEEQTVVRKTWHPSPTEHDITLASARPTILTQDQLLSVADVKNGTERILAYNVTFFEPLRAVPVSEPTFSRIRLEKSQPGRSEPVSLELKRTVNFRN